MNIESRLRSIYFECNRLKRLSECVEELIGVNLSENKDLLISDDIFNNMSYLKDLNLNRIKGIFESYNLICFKLENLEKLRLSGCCNSKDKNILILFKNSTNLKILEFGDYDFNGNMLNNRIQIESNELISPSRKLKLNKEPSTKEIIRSFINLEEIRIFNLGLNAYDLDEFFINLTKFRIVDLSNNKLKKIPIELKI